MIFGFYLVRLRETSHRKKQKNRAESEHRYAGIEIDSAARHYEHYTHDREEYSGRDS